MSDSSVSTLIAGLKQGDEAAAERLWIRYFEKLVALAKRELSSFPTRAWDEEDVALSALDSLFRGAKQGSFRELSDREDLWTLLLRLTRHKIVDRKRRDTRQKRGGGKLPDASAGNSADDIAARGIEQLLAQEPTSDSLVELEEQYSRLLDLLPDDNWRRIAVLRMEGYKVREIAAEFGNTVRWAERKLESIRKKWARELKREE